MQTAAAKVLAIAIPITKTKKKTEIKTTTKAEVGVRKGTKRYD